MSSAARALLLYFAGRYPVWMVGDAQKSWNYDASHCPSREAVDELVAEGLATRPYEAKYLINLTEAGLAALDQVRKG